VTRILDRRPLFERRRPLSLVSAEAVIVIVSLLACRPGPARRASRADPTEIMRAR
jgi:ABC-type lipoprotein release transport system permease subunit